MLIMLMNCNSKSTDCTHTYTSMNMCMGVIRYINDYNLLYNILSFYLKCFANGINKNNNHDNKDMSMSSLDVCMHVWAVGWMM